MPRVPRCHLREKYSEEDLVPQMQRGRQLHWLVGSLQTGDVGDHSKEDDGKADVQKKPKGGHGKKEAAGAASKRCRKDSSGDHGIACKKAKPK